MLIFIDVYTFCFNQLYALVMIIIRLISYVNLKVKKKVKQVAFQSNANHPLAESTGYMKFEGM